LKDKVLAVMYLENKNKYMWLKNILDWIRLKNEKFILNEPRIIQLRMNRSKINFCI
jgi:hypothetical protein